MSALYAPAAGAPVAPGQGAAPGAGPAPLLDAQGLSLQLAGRSVVQNASLALRGGCWVAIVGPNGAGKSSLLSLLAGLRAPASGSVRLKGRPLAEWAPRERATQLAWLAQAGESEGDLSARDVVRLARLPRQGLFGAPDAADEAAVDAAMAETECSGLADRRLGELSGGERQRVLLARALAVGAPVLLLDEPTTHLDAPHQRALLRSLRTRAAAGAAVAAVLHDLTLALQADRVLLMRDGRIAAEGAPGDPALHVALVEAFGHSLHIAQVELDGGRTRWTALPAD